MLGMLVRRMTMLVATAALLGAVAGGAQAADKKPTVDFTVRQEPPLMQQGGAKTMKWDARRGRFGLTLNLEQPEARASTLNDVEAGAYYRITPSLRVGGAVALGDQNLVAGAPKKPGQDDGQPRVRLETNFKF